MKPMLEHLPREKGRSFVVCDFRYDYYPTPWHYHPEYEIVLVTESTGRRYIGDNISSFREGDLVLIGPDLPHTYKNDPEYYAGDPGLKACSIVVHFREDSLGTGALDLPEAKHIRNLLKKSRYGLGFSGSVNRRVSTALRELTELKDFSRWMKLWEVLDALASCPPEECRVVSSGNMAEQYITDEERLQKVLAYMSRHFRQDITLDQVAELAHMAPAAFSRYFKHCTRKTFSSFLLELRTSHAAGLLVQTDRSIGDICYESGFNNLSNFNRHFKSYYRMQPREYRKQFIQ